MADGFARQGFHLGDTAAVGLGLADMLVFLAAERVEHACQHLSLSWDPAQDTLVEPWYDPLRPDGTGGVRETPAYAVTRLFAGHLLERYATITDEGAGPVDTYRFGDAAVPAGRVSPVAFASADGRAGTVFFLHREIDLAERVTFDVEEGVSVIAATQWAPAAWNEDTTGKEIPVTDAEIRQVGREIQVLAPPHSVVALRVERR